MPRGTKTVNHPDSAHKPPQLTQLENQPHRDQLNQSIIQMLQTDGRMPYSEIAIALGVSEGTIRNRVVNMKKAGMLQIVAIVDPAASEYTSDAMLGIKVGCGHSVESVSQRLAESQYVVYILWVSGRFDLLVEVVCDDRLAFLEFLDRQIHSQPDIGACETMSGLKNFKNQFMLKQNWS